LIILQAVIVVIVTSALGYLPGFLLAEPQFLCPNSGTGKLEECKEDLWCDKYYPGKWTPDMVDWKYEYSWVKKEMIICEDGASRAQYRNINMILSTFVVYVFITLSDSMGRARTLRVALLFIVAAALTAYFIDSIVVKVIGLSF
jgi:hypothetical protein